MDILREGRIKMYKSTVLNCNSDDDECAVCRFLNGDRTGGVLMSVIKTLDNSLADSERVAWELCRVLAKRKDG